MAKTQVKQKIPKKACFGTKEWSENSGICGRCNYKEECGKANKERNNQLILEYNNNYKVFI